MNLPNIITFLRLCLIPFFVYFMWQEKYLFALLSFIVAGITDIIDGYIARKFNLVTKYGELWDPLVDKLFQFSALIMLAVKSIVPNIWIVLFVIFIKETLMIVGGIILYRKNVVVRANKYGKAATFIFYVAVILSIIFSKLTPLSPNYSFAFLIIAVISTLVAFSQYLINYLRITKK